MCVWKSSLLTLRHFRFDEVLQLKGENFRFQEQEFGGSPQIFVTVPLRTSNPIYPSQRNEISNHVVQWTRGT